MDNTNIATQKSPKQQTSALMNDLKMFSVDTILNQSLPLFRKMSELADVDAQEIFSAILGKKIMFYLIK